MSSLVGNARANTWETDDSDQQFGDNKSIDIWNIEILQKEGNARINKVSAMRPG